MPIGHRYAMTNSQRVSGITDRTEGPLDALLEDYVRDDPRPTPSRRAASGAPEMWCQEAYGAWFWKHLDVNACRSEILAAVDIAQASIARPTVGGNVVSEMFVWRIAKIVESIILCAYQLDAWPRVKRFRRWADRRDRCLIDLNNANLLLCRILRAPKSSTSALSFVSVTLSIPCSLEFLAKCK